MGFITPPHGSYCEDVNQQASSMWSRRPLTFCIHSVYIIIPTTWRVLLYLGGGGDDDDDDDDDDDTHAQVAVDTYQSAMPIML